MAPEDFNICDTRPESRVLAGVKEARRVGKCFIAHFFRQLSLQSGSLLLDVRGNITLVSGPSSKNFHGFAERA